ncbi:quinone oxidoreductase family protein [Bradyrhizobium sp. GCM10027634]|uniref:quinone oxidoreductase family protein n=1 Tax=unclassified Bradyrhizobium TaxID=2631580 RepID=UPI00188BAF3D|nr:MULTISPECIES: quinone oxidoreductase [unclassified Bradyrhizobium]MDN5000540.1 quinone oxidoreductase [Bradyrhizobium sp. WYCCWR 12677]QOZ42717.1 quinone oxidoreductase [Bradyrhizobium sp. CCBAU 53340]
MAVMMRVKAPGGVDQLELASADLPPPGRGEVRLRQTAIGVNFIDIYQRLGLYALPPERIPGVEAVGVVAALGSEVTGLEVGDRVAYAGTPVGAYASERNMPAWRCVKIPAGLPDELVAAAFVKGITADMLLGRVFPVGRGTSVLVHSAAGGLGQLLTRWASARGAVVIGTVGSPAKVDIARAAGARHVIVGRDADFAAAVADFTTGAGVDVAYDGVGGTTLQKTFGCVRPFGVVASIGQSAGPIPSVEVNELGPRRSLMLARPSVMAHMNDASAYRASAERVLAAMAEGVLTVIGKAYSLQDAALAQADLEAGRTTGALYLRP